MPRDPVRPSIVTLPWTCSVRDVIGAWPADRRLVALVSGECNDPAEGAAQRSRWSILASPVESLTRPVDGTALDLLGAASSKRIPGDDSGVPFVGGWIGWINYGLGGVIEPTARSTHARGGGAGSAALPGVELHRCPGAYIHDAATGVWHVVGDRLAVPTIDPVAGSAAAACDDSPGWRAGRLRSEMGRRGYERAVARAIEYIREGDIFQANIAHAMRCEFEGSTRALFLSLLGAAAPWYGSYIETAECDGRTLVSISPELFLEADLASGAVTTRPIKGTRAAGHGLDLARSEKDAAELVMIVDLMRNDLGRLCRYGTVKVDDPRSIERHAGVVHGVATVSGVLREGVTLDELVRATFPPGSVTGAPKVRAMQVIDELETFERGPYCGAIGFISRCGRTAWSVAIRTAMIKAEREPVAREPGASATGEKEPAVDSRGTEHCPRTLTYPVGAGIVADSDPAREWEETLQKASAFARVLGHGRGSEQPTLEAIG